MNDRNSTSIRCASGMRCGIAHRGTQQSLDAIHPVGGETVGVDLVAPVAVAVGQHRDGRLQHRHRISQGEGHRRIGEGGEQGTEALQVLRTLQHPPVRSSQVAHDLQFLAEEPVVGVLVEGLGVVAPAGTRACHSST